MLLQLNPPRAPQVPHLAGLVRPERRPARVRARIGTRSSSNARVLAAHLAAPGRARADPGAVVARVARVAPLAVVAARRREGPRFRDLRPPPLDREPGPVKTTTMRLDGPLYETDMMRSMRNGEITPEFIQCMKEDKAQADALAAELKIDHCRGVVTGVYPEYC